MIKLRCKYKDKETNFCKLLSKDECLQDCVTGDDCLNYAPIEEPSAEVEKEFQEFWKDIVCNDDGTLNPIAVKNELSDYSFLLEQVPSVYSEITGGRLSYPNYDAETVLTLFREEFANKAWAIECLADDWDDITADCETNEDYKRVLFKYLEIDDEDKFIN